MANETIVRDVKEGKCNVVDASKESSYDVCINVSDEKDRRRLASEDTIADDDKVTDF